MSTVVALLDSPSAKSFAIVPLLLDTGSGLTVSGTALPMKSAVLTEQRLRAIERTGSVLRLQTAASIHATPVNAVAYWIGDEFQAEAQQLGLLPAIPIGMITTASLGRFAILSSSEAYSHLMDWMSVAFERTVLHSDPRVARLMRWALPAHDFTRAAQYFTADELGRSRLDRLWSHEARYRDPSARKTLYERLQDLVASRVAIVAREQQLVIGVVSPARSSHYDISHASADMLKAELFSYKKYFNELAKNLGKEPSRPVLQDEGERRASNPKFLCDLALNFQPPLIVDGIKHSTIVDEFRARLGARFVLVRVEVDPALQRARLAQEDPTLDPDKVLAHATEQDIPELSTQAVASIRSEEFSPNSLQILTWMSKAVHLSSIRDANV